MTHVTLFEKRIIHHEEREVHEEKLFEEHYESESDSFLGVSESLREFIISSDRARLEIP